MNDRLPLQELVGTKLGDYTIQRVLGHGSMGVVFEAVHAQLGRRVALKALPPGLGATEKAIQRFLREAQAVAQLSHESIVPIYEIAQSGVIHYYAMQFLDGEPLDRVIRRGPLDPRHAARLACTAARAIHFAHQHGIIHRDIKPGNLILQVDGKLVLTDFGLARPEQGGGITDSGALVGTPLYMSPEQVRATKGGVDRRTDIYSLGATLYEMVAGRPPFPGDSTQEILQRILDEEPHSPRTFVSAIPADLEVVTMRALEKEPKRRYQSALEMAQDLERFLEGEPILARRTTIFGRSWRRVKKHRTIAVLSLVIAALALGSSAIFKLQRDSARERTFRSAIATARASFADENYLNARDKFDEALRERPGDLDARLGRARALCFIGQEWESENQKAGRETRPPLVDRFGSVEKLYADALADVRAVAEAQKENALAVFYRGFLGWRSRGKLEERNAAVEDLTAAEAMGEDDWETQAELAKFRLGLARDPKRDPDQRGELLQQALTNASRAVKLADQRSATLPPRLLFQTWLRRAEIYWDLYDLAGNLPLYLELARTDCDRALVIVPKEPRAVTLLGNVTSRLADVKKSTETQANALAASPSASAPLPNAAPAASTAPDVTRGVLALLGVAQKSAQSDALAGLLKSGAELLATGWQQTDGIREGLMDQFVNPYVGDGARVTDAARGEAAAEVDAAHKILQTGLDRGAIAPAERRTARDHLARAVAKNPRNAQYLFELAVVEQAMGELDSAHDHLQRATTIATSNPLFFHQLALVCEQMRRYDEALGSARRSEELAPENVEFVAHHALLSIESAEQSTDAAQRTKLVGEARAELATLERLAPADPTRAALAHRLETLTATKSGASSGGE